MRKIIRAVLANEHAFMLTVAIAIGVVAGYGAVGFRALIGQAETLFFGPGSSLIERVSALPFYWVILLPAIGGLIVGPIVHFFAHESKGHGVPEVIEAVLLRGGAIRPRVVVARLLASAVTIGSGGSVGREGPIVQIGAAAGSFVGQVLKVSEDHLKTFVGCGAGAGIAATFNAPIAGPLFAAEIILGGFGARTFSPIVLSSVMATVVSRYYLGDHPAFVVPEFELVHPLSIVFYTVLGAIAGVIAVVFIRVLYAGESLFEKAPIPGYLTPMVGGALVGSIGILFPGVLGLGYESIDLTLSGQMAWKLMVALLAVKILATTITLGSGGSGGIFVPSLFMGAMAGGLVWTVVNSIAPEIAGPSGSYALVGMAAVVSAATHAPITAILIIFELTGDYKIILPVMSACVISVLVASSLMRDSIYTLKLSRRGVEIIRGREATILRSVHVKDIFHREVDTLEPGASFDEIIALFQRTRQDVLPVVGTEGNLLGLVSAEDLKPHMRESQLGGLVLALDVMTPPNVVVCPDENLDQALTKFAAQTGDELPVMASPGSDKMIGLVSQSDLLKRYEKEIRQRRLAREL